MPLTRFPDHEDKRVFLSTVLSFNLPPPDGAHSDRLSVAVLWVDRDTPSADELSPDFAMELLDHGALALVIGGSASEQTAALFERTIEDGEFVRGPDEEISIWVDPEAPLDEVLWTAAEEAMPPTPLPTGRGISSAGPGVAMPWWPSCVMPWRGSAPLWMIAMSWVVTTNEQRAPACLPVWHVGTRRHSACPDSSPHSSAHGG